MSNTIRRILDPDANEKLPWKGYRFELDEGIQSHWIPLEGSQSVVLDHQWVFELLYHGTRGPGKSDVLLMDFAQFIPKGWGLAYKGIIFRKTYKQLEDLVTKSKEIFKLMFPGARFLASKSDYKWVFPNGEELLFRSFDKADDYWNYHGHEYQFVGFDELTNWPDLQGYTSMMSCLRTTHPDIPLRIRATTNPYGVGHNAVKFYFELPAKDGIVREKLYSFEDPITGEKRERLLQRLAVRGTIWENTYILKNQPDYIANLEKQADNPAKYAAWLLGSWDIVAGGMFDDVWDAKYNAVPRFKIPPTWRIDRAFDWGSSKPFSVGWWAQSDGSDFIDGRGMYRSSVRGDIYRIHEWYGWSGKPNEGLRMLAVDITKGIVEREQKLWPGVQVFAGPADSSIFDVENGESIAVDMSKKFRDARGMMQNGVNWTKADKRPGSRKNGWQLMRQYIKDAHPNENGPREKPGLFVFDHCDQFLRTVPVLPRCEKDPDDVDTDVEDHIGDEARYRIRAAGNRGGSGTVTGMH